MMKKVMLLAATLCVVTMASVAYTSHVKAKGKDDQSANVPSYILTVNGKVMQMDIHELIPYEQKGTVMVPLRITAEALGYSVGWATEEKAVRVEDSVQWALVKSGSAQAKFTGKLKIINLSQEVELPAPVQTRKGVTYVPASFFEPFFNDVVIQEGNVSISAQKSTIQ